RLRVHVDRIRGNIGITPLTEAAVQLQDDPAFAQRPPDERIRAANDQVLVQVNSQMPVQFALTDITMLPVLVGPGSLASKDETNTLTLTTPAGRYGSFIAGLSIAAGE